MSRIPILVLCPHQISAEAWWMDQIRERLPKPTCVEQYVYESYGVATISRLLKRLGLFCRMQSLSQGSFAKETYNFKESNDPSHPIAPSLVLYLRQISAEEQILHEIRQPLSNPTAQSSVYMRTSYLVLHTSQEIRLEGDQIRALVGSLKDQVSFAEYSLFHRALLQKRRTSYLCEHLTWYYIDLKRLDQRVYA